MYIVSFPDRIQLTRCIRRNMEDWTLATELYVKCNIFPWKIAGMIGVKMTPKVKQDRSEPQPAELETFGLAVPLLPPTGLRNEQPSTPFTPDEAASDPETDGYEPSIAPQGMEHEVVEQAGESEDIPREGVAGAAKRANEEGDQTGSKQPKVEPQSSSGIVRDQPDLDMEQPAKKQKEEPRKSLRTNRIEAEHLDMNDFEDWENWESLDIFQPEDWNSQDDVDDTNDSDDREHELIFRCQHEHEAEPELSTEALCGLDELADKFEVARLIKMGVLKHEEHVDTHEVINLIGSPLSAKFVRSWRSKSDSKGNYWLRRSRLVAREYKTIEERNDVFSPASSSSIVRLLPALKVTHELPKDWVLCGFDVGDAFLMVPQENPRKVRVINSDMSFVIYKMLPGQRDGAKRWFSYFTQYLRNQHQLQTCVECPALLRGPRGVMLLHVDDVLMVCNDEWLTKTFLPDLKTNFKISLQVARKSGESVNFLKRQYVIVDEGITVVHSHRHVETLIEKFEKCNNGRRPRVSKTPYYPALFQETGVGELLEEQKAADFRSLVGLLLYISHDRWDLSFAVKSLASFLKTPTVASGKALSKIVGYLIALPTASLLLRQGNPGMNNFESMAGRDTELGATSVEVHTDSDWQGSFGKSTSCAIHFVNGVPVHFTSRTQKVTSLSSTESEWYSACSGVSDGLFIKYCVEFLTARPSTFTLKVDNNGARFLAHKSGSGRIKHMRGKYLWLQELVEQSELQVKGISTLLNTSDLGTKCLPRGRLFTLMCMIGFQNADGESIGEQEYQTVLLQEGNRRKVRQLCQMIALETSLPPVESQVATLRASRPMTSENVKFVKRVLAAYTMASVVPLVGAKEIELCYLSVCPTMPLNLVLVLCVVVMVVIVIKIVIPKRERFQEGNIVSKHTSVYDMASFTVYVFGTCVSHFLIVYFGYMVVNTKIGLIDFLDMNIYIGDLNKNDFKILMMRCFQKVACITVGFSTGLSLAMLLAVVSGDQECKEVEMDDIIENIEIASFTHQPDRGAEQIDGNVERVHEILDIVAEPAAASYLANENEDTGLALSEEQWG